jgi:hypothetical protein
VHKAGAATGSTQDTLGQILPLAGQFEMTTDRNVVARLTGNRMVA